MIGVLPTAFAVAGTALMSVAMFAPFRKRAEREAGVCVSDTTPYAKWLALDVPHWPALVDASAEACDARARIDLADALGALSSAWAEAILLQANETETDPAVRAAISSALSSSQSLVT